MSCLPAQKIAPVANSLLSGKVIIHLERHPSYLGRLGSLSPHAASTKNHEAHLLHLLFVLMLGASIVHHAAKLAEDKDSPIFLNKKYAIILNSCISMLPLEISEYLFILFPSMHLKLLTIEVIMQCNTIFSG